MSSTYYNEILFCSYNHNSPGTALITRYSPPLLIGKLFKLMYDKSLSDFRVKYRTAEAYDVQPTNCLD